MDNNMIDDGATAFTISSEDATNVSANVVLPNRNAYWETTGHFEITTSNHELYINDGSDKTVSITVGDYTTPDALATQITTDLNAASTNWTVSHSPSTYKFTIANTGSVTLRETQTTDAIWDTLGYTNGTDHAGTSFEAEEVRVHTEEYVELDLGSGGDIEPTFVGLVVPVDSIFVSSSATIKLQGNASAVWTSPTVDKTLTRLDDGSLEFLDDGDVSAAFRFWSIYIEDRELVTGPSIKISYLYLGDYLTLTERNTQSGFNMSRVDPSDSVETELGAQYFHTRYKYWEFTGMVLPYMVAADRLALQEFFEEVGVQESFFISLDPELAVSTTIDEYTKWVKFNSSPNIRHIKADVFSFMFDLKEAL